MVCKGVVPSLSNRILPSFFFTYKLQYNRRVFWRFYPLKSQWSVIKTCKQNESVIMEKKFAICDVHLYRKKVVSSYVCIELLDFIAVSANVPIARLASEHWYVQTKRALYNHTRLVQCTLQTVKLYIRKTSSKAHSHIPPPSWDLIRKISFL